VFEFCDISSKSSKLWSFRVLGTSE